MMPVTTGSCFVYLIILCHHKGFWSWSRMPNNSTKALKAPLTCTQIAHHLVTFILGYDILKLCHAIYTVSQKKSSHFNFRHNFAICWDIFRIFETPCSGLISALYSVLHSHHWCEAFGWHDVTHDISQAVALNAHWHQISYHLTYSFWTHQT